MKVWTASENDRKLAVLAAHSVLQGCETGGEWGWFVVRTNPKCEMLAFDGLTRAGLRPWMPVVRKLRRRRHTKSRTRPVLHPLLPGYLFVQMPLADAAWHRLAPVNGVKAAFGRDGRGKNLPLLDADIDAFRAFCESGVFDEKRARAHWRREAKGAAQIYQADDVVRILEGPYAGMTFRFDGYANGQTGRVLMQLFGTLRAVEIPLEMLARAS